MIPVSRVILLFSVLLFATACSCGGGQDNPDQIVITRSDDDTADIDQTQFVILSDAEESSPTFLAAHDTASLLSEATGRDIKALQQIDPQYNGVVISLNVAGMNDVVFSDADLNGLPSESYRLRRADVKEMIILAVAAPDERGAQYGLYRLLEILGFRFFHPEQTYIPAQDDMAVPENLDIAGSPSYGRRGFHIHTMHPIEASEFLQRDKPGYLDYAKRLIDWHVRNRQNYMQFELLRTVDWDATLAHFQAIAEYAHQRGMDIGVAASYVLQQQKAWKLLPDARSEHEAELHAAIDRLMQVPWDHINLELGTSEFTSVDDRLLVQWMDDTAAYLAEAWPGTEASVKVHVSTGQTAPHYGGNFNFLPQFADTRMGVYPHTVQFYDLQGPAPTYGNENFHEIYNWMLDRVGERKVYYYPETAYWVSFDIDVPLFLPIYILSRGKDIALLADKGIDGHVTFTSGHEWNYWLSDWAVARLTWDATQDWTAALADFTEFFGEAAEGIAGDIAELATDQEENLIGRNLISYICGQDTWVELGWLFGTYTHVKPVTFQELYAMDGVELTEFEQDVLQPLADMAEHYGVLLEDVRSRETGIPDNARGWYRELRDSFETDALRASHAAALYQGAVAQRRFELGLDPAGETTANRFFQNALDITTRQIDLVRERESAYRYPIDLSTKWERSLTSYDFHYLSQADEGYWNRRYEAQAIDKNFNPLLMNVIDPIWFLF